MVIFLATPLLRALKEPYAHATGAQTAPAHPWTRQNRRLHRYRHRFDTFDRWRYLFGTPVVAFLACSHSRLVPPGHPNSVQGPICFLCVRHGSPTPWQGARLPAHPPRSSLYRSSLVGTVICSRQLLGNNTLSYRSNQYVCMSPIRSTLPAQGLLVHASFSSEVFMGGSRM